MTVKVAIAGCTGYAGGELLRLLAQHPEVEVGALTGRSSAGDRLVQHHPQLSAYADRIVEPTELATLRGHDVVFLALPHGASGPLAAELSQDTLVIDAGADFRLESSQEWQAFYGSPHAGTWPYGMPELPGQREVLAQTRRVAVPGCFPTTATLALLPAVTARLVTGEDVVIVAPTAPSGAGKAAKAHLMASELLGSATAYGVGGGHRHNPEIRQNLRRLGAAEPTVSFTPVLVPMSRGILATCTAPLASPTTADQVRQAYLEAYADEPFVQLLPEGQWPQTQSALGSNMCQVQVTVDEAAGRLVAIAALDNLTKGTSGAAIQCMNLALGLPETTGLHGQGVAP
ncbi:N-acetyl-gamma-glutamyl-phosphate reductase [Parenemella sanctibonifatiensis]|uniref:N-acetyl-gamma-glutamyl-phosphate reductase n=1 Tax=Parenemella sanctibonifatiensis TaxID=2016505 RepID=A0A255EIF9_9ACTN|nr:N-acetyl-gamma-glutamyl-phosphate reductase [Parenemella sanctibonifatiensis]OYN91319.1 N-acetyl-gamma-glutamyl-phosphate reductase [Parenemella sanctibonifatiensis]